MSDTARGANLRVVLITVDVGEEVWERYGHNALWITDTRTGEQHAWNWGMFDFHQPSFITRFVFGNTRYSLDSVDVPGMLNYYASVGRATVGQELALTPGQRAALDALVRANVNGEDKYYRYDSHYDNCATRLRDALDIVLGGALHRALGAQGAHTTLREESLRPVQHNAGLFLGIDFLLGARTDRPLDEWQDAFIPMRLRDALRAVRVDGPNGTSVPLVVRERVLIAPRVPLAPPAVTTGWWGAWMLGVSLALAIVFVGASRVAERGSRAAGVAAIVLAVVVHLTIGLSAALAAFMWIFTRHTVTGLNPHLLLFTPLSVVVAVLLPFRMRAWRRGNWIERYHILMAGVAFVVAIAVLASHMSELTVGAGLLFAWATASSVLHFGMGGALSRVARTATAAAAAHGQSPTGTNAFPRAT